jgi:hypothetical protein
MVENEFRVMVVDVFGAVFCFKWNSSNGIARYLYCGCTYPQYRHIYHLLPGWAGLDPLLTMEAQAGCVHPCPRDVTLISRLSGRAWNLANVGIPVHYQVRCTSPGLT